MNKKADVSLSKHATEKLSDPNSKKLGITVSVLQKVLEKPELIDSNEYPLLAALGKLNSNLSLLPGIERTRNHRLERGDTNDRLPVKDEKQKGDLSMTHHVLRFTHSVIFLLIMGAMNCAPTAFAAKDEKAAAEAPAGGGSASGGKPAAPTKATPADFSQVEKLARANSDLAVDIYRMAAQWCLNRNQAAQAAAFYEEALTAAPGQARLLEELAEAQLAAGKKKEAAATWTEIYKVSSKDVGLRVRYAGFLVKVGEDDQAIKMIREIAGERPQDASMRYWIADAYVRAGKSKDAAQELEAMLKTFPEEGKEIKRRLGLLGAGKEEGEAGMKKEEEEKKAGRRKWDENGRDNASPLRRRDISRPASV